MANYLERHVTAGGATIRYLEGGQGAPVIVLHSFEGNLGWLPAYDGLASKSKLYLPTHPGFAGSDRPEWLESFTDLARFYLWIVQELGVAKASFIGHGIGGWLAAEIAVMSPLIVDRLVLVDAAGVRPRISEITDIFLHGSEGARRLSFHDSGKVPDYDRLFGRKPDPEEREAEAINREAAIRYCWKPYMHDPSLLPLLRRLRGIPTLIVWGREDRLIPLECAELYHGAIAGSQLEVIEGCGYFPQLERAEDFSRLVGRFLGG
jgi:pimeloyl-ACP methyl ester carboxylesterase